MTSDPKAPVTTTWLASAFGMTPQRVREKLVGCPVAGSVGRGNTYRIRDAASYLVEPNVNLEVLLAGLKPKDFPPELQNQFWAAKIKRQTYEERAQDLWPTERVQAVISQVFGLIKSQVQLFAETVERQEGLSEEQRSIITQLADGLLDDIHTEIVSLAGRQATPSSISEDEEDGNP